MAVFDSFDEGGRGWAKTRLVEKFDGVRDCSCGYDTVDVFRHVFGACDAFFKFYASKTSTWFAVSFEDGLGIDFDCDLGLCEVYFASIVAEEGNGDQGVLEFLKDVSNACVWR